jgi:ribosome-binding protein aMBF1 (putative translation factor)
MSYCELCGHQTFEKKMVVVDGTVFNVCVACSKRGKPYVLPQIAAKRKKPLAAKPQKKIGLADETRTAWYEDERESTASEKV